LAVSCTLLFLLLTFIAALPPSALALTASQVYEQVKDSVVVVKAYDQTGKPVGLGSGVMLPSGDVITNYHVVKTGVRYTVGQGKQATPATVKAGDPDKDLCLLTAPGIVAEPVRLGKTARLKVGEPVYAVGAPQGLELSLSEGIVSQLRGGPPPLIQTTVAISKGSSGGGLFNAEAELVGLTTFYLNDGQSLNFALPVEWIGEVAPGKIRERPIGKAPVAPVPGERSKESWENRAEALKKADDWQGLLAHCRRWTQAEPGNVVAWHFLGATYAMLDRHREAVEANREALRLKPDYAEAWHNLGFEYIIMERYREAIDASREALRLKPDYADAWYNLARAYALSGNQSAALEAVKELRRYDPQKAEKLFNLIMKP
jgi:Flp pilus assembly protein TadD